MLFQTVQISNAYPTYNSIPCYYEIKKYSYSEQFSKSIILSTNFMLQKMQELDNYKQKANERFFKKTGHRLSQIQMKCIDSILVCNYTSKPLISFYEDKIKVQIDVNKNKYMLDFEVNNFDNTVLVGSYKNSEYKIKRVFISDLENVIRG